MTKEDQKRESPVVTLSSPPNSQSTKTMRVELKEIPREFQVSIEHNLRASRPHGKKAASDE